MDCTEIYLDTDFDVFDTNSGGGVIDGEWTCYECESQNEIIDITVTLEDVICCEQCGKRYIIK